MMPMQPSDSNTSSGGNLNRKMINLIGTYVEDVLDRTGTRGRHLNLQFVVDWDFNEPIEKNYLGPDWVAEKSRRASRIRNTKRPVHSQDAGDQIQPSVLRGRGDRGDHGTDKLLQRRSSRFRSSSGTTRILVRVAHLSS